MIRLNGDGTRVGRGSDADLRIHDLAVSRRHAALSVDQREGTWLTDLGSTNGTLRNGRRLAPHTPTRLVDGDRIQFGTGYVAKFVALDPNDERFQRELFERSVRDPLTGLYNRAYFRDQVAPTANLAEARGLGLAVILLDIDHFKRVNDTYGHDAGDLVLREVAQVLRDG
ncbi:MAG: GGDEF domain-containing protein, partial [Thermoleophilia bacterium]|nr:GGDEF domain-containing protein [Thermoleophilia bacterium]